MSDTIFIKRSTIDNPNKNPLHWIDEQSSHWITYKFAFNIKDGITTFSAELKSHVEHYSYYEIITKTLFDSENAIVNDEIIQTMHKYILEAFNDHLGIIKNHFKSQNMLGLKYKEEANYEDYRDELEKAIKEAV